MSQTIAIWQIIKKYNELQSKADMLEKMIVDDSVSVSEDVLDIIQFNETVQQYIQAKGALITFEDEFVDVEDEMFNFWNLHEVF